MDVIVKWTLISLYLVNIVLTVLLIGKPRKALTPGMAAFNVVIAGSMAVAIALTWDTSR